MSTRLCKKKIVSIVVFMLLERSRRDGDVIMIVDQLDYSRVRALGGKHMQYRFDDYARRYFW